MRILSLGAGVQSSTMALMAAHGEIEIPDCAIFADTQWEPKAVYDWLAWLEKQLPFPVYRVTRGSLREEALKAHTNERSVSIPWMMENGIGARQCTNDFKVVPLRRKMRELLGTSNRSAKVRVMIGISLDEAHRAKPSRNNWQIHEWPLLDKRMTRSDCLAWMERKGYPLPPKSSCLGCPYHSDQQWQEIKKNKDEWEDIIMIDKFIRNQPKFRKQQFMHRSLKPIDEVQFTNEDQIDMFGNECEGMCGV